MEIKKEKLGQLVKPRMEHTGEPERTSRLGNRDRWVTKDAKGKNQMEKSMCSNCWL